MKKSIKKLKYLRIVIHFILMVGFFIASVYSFYNDNLAWGFGYFVMGSQSCLLTITYVEIKKYGDLIQSAW